MNQHLLIRNYLFILSLSLLGFNVLFGQAGDALEFDGNNNSRVTILDAPSLDLLNGTIELWVYYAGVGGNKYFVDKNLEYLFRTSNKKFQVLIHAGGNYHTLIDPGTLTSNTWYHLAVTYDGSTVKLYRDGNATPVATFSTSGSINNTTNSLHLGARPTNAGEAWTGAVDEFRVWNKALTGTEIAGLYNKTLIGTNVMDCLKVYYKMSDGSGTTLTDNSGNGNSGTISGNTMWISSTAGITGTNTPSSCSQVLPVELVFFKAKMKDQKTYLTWQTASEINNEGFEIEHSPDGNTWRNIGFVNGNGTNYELTNYQFLHQSAVSGINYYRLKQMDFDGNYEYSKTVSINVEKGGNIVVYPNPSTGKFNISGIDIRNAEVSIYNTVGQLVKEEMLTQLVLDISDLVDGLYYLAIQQGSVVYEMRVVKKK